MAATLVFQLQAVFASWGEPAVGEYRGTAEMPSRSALIGLLGAALGIDRVDEGAHASLRDGYGYATGLLREGNLLRDYHTTQVPPRSALKGIVATTRRQETALPRDKLSVVLSTRDYRQNAAWLVALQPRATAAYSLEAIAEALRRPHFVLYLGRKSCAPTAPLCPQILAEDYVEAAFARYVEAYEARRAAHADSAVSGRNLRDKGLEAMPMVAQLAWDDHARVEAAADFTVPRKDRVVRRDGWQFGDRDEHVRLTRTAALTPES